MKTYSKAAKPIHDVANEVIHRWYPELEKIGVRLDILTVAVDGDDEFALKLHGYPCNAVIRVTNIKERTKGLGDCEITIDELRYIGMDEKERLALLDHEIHHIEVQLTKKGRVKLDTAARPKIKLRLHDHDFGWFEAIADRHGPSSIEVQQATTLFRNHKQTYFGFALESAKQPADK